MPHAWVGLGSNLGNRLENLVQAVRRFRAEPGLRLLRVSSFYETEPVDCPPGSEPFLNAVAELETDRPAEQLLKFLLQVETQSGRKRTGQINDPRPLDLDLLSYDQLTNSSEFLSLPHPRLHQRAFVLVPLIELEPNWRHPTLGQTAQELLGQLPAEAVEPPPRKVLPAAVSGLQPLIGQTVLITGSTAGIGAAMAKQFEGAGARVIRHGRKPRPEIAALPFLAADLTQPDSWKYLANDAWEQFGPIDGLICNAGADTLTGEAANWDFADKLDALLNVDLKATMHLSRAIGARMKQQGTGWILTVGWDQAETGMEGDSGQLFAAVKGAIICFTRSLALSLAPEVRVNCLAPGWIRTAWGETASAIWQDRVRRETPLEVWGLPEDVAAAALWLASPQAQFQTGQTIRINGGAVR